MDEASRLITELQEKLAELDHKVWLYGQDMALEFKKHTDGLLRDVPEDVSNKVMESIAESLKRYPSFNPDCLDTDRPSKAESSGTLANSVTDNIGKASQTAPLSVVSYDGPESPLEGPQSLHEREKEFQGLFTPSYLPLLDGTDRNERRLNSTSHSPSASERKTISIISRERATEDTSPTSSSYPSSLPTRTLRTPQRRDTDEASIHSDQSDTPVRRSALRRSSSSSKSQSPRHVRFEFAGEEFPTTSSPKLEAPEVVTAKRIAIILGNGDESYDETGSQQVEYAEDSPPPKRISSSDALRVLSRGPIEDDGTLWTEVRAPPDGSPSVPRAEANNESSEDEDFPSLPVASGARLASGSNGHKARDSIEKLFSTSDSSEPSVGHISRSKGEMEVARSGDDASPDIADEQDDVLSEMPPLQAMKSQRPISTISAATPEKKYAHGTQAVSFKSSSKPRLILLDGIDLNDFSDTTTKLRVEDDDELFAFDESPDRSFQKPEPEPDPDSESESPTSDTAEEAAAQVTGYATSPARHIISIGTTQSTNVNSNTTILSTAHRSLCHPFQTPIVSEAIHAQAASLGDVTSFVGSVKNGLDESALQSFKASVGGGVGSLRGGVPRSLSERMAFDEAMEEKAREEARKK